MSVLRATIKGTFFGQQVMNVLHFNKPDLVEAELLTLANDLRDNWCETLKSLLGQEAYFLGIQVRNIENNSWPAREIAFSKQGLAGGIANTFPFACFIMRIQTGTFGRAGRGRIYIWGIGPGSMSGGILLPAVTTNWQTWLTQITNRYCLAGSTYRLGVCPRAAPQDFKSAISVSLSPKAGVQRRRNIGVGV